MSSNLRRFLHATFFALLAAGTLVALFYAEEDWRGDRAWNATKRDLKARGESVDSANLIPPPVPDDQNLAMAPFFTRVYRYKVDPRTGLLTFDNGAHWSGDEASKILSTIPWGESQPGVPYPTGTGNWTTGRGVDLSLVQAYYRRHKDFTLPPQPGTPAEDVLLALSRYRPLLDELARAAAERPLTRFPVNWTLHPAWGIALPHYNLIQVLTTTLRLRAVAELDAGQAPAARRDVDLMFRLRQTMATEPTLIANLVDITCLNILVQPIWEGLRTRRWTAEDLDAVRDNLRGINILREYQQAMRGERAFFAASLPGDLQSMATARDLAKVLPQLMGEDPVFSSLDRWLWRLLPYWPHGWYEQNAALMCRQLQTDWIDIVDPATHRMNYTRNQAVPQVMKDTPATPYTLLARSYLPVFGSISNKFMQAQTTLDETATACALEKYYLEHHAYPATLAELVPTYLDQVPHDIIDNAPLRYRLTVDGRYQLYSIGLDGHDDGGTVVWPANSKTATFLSPDKFHGDWVWQYAPAEPPDPPANTSRLESLPSR